MEGCGEKVGGGGVIMIIDVEQRMRVPLPDFLNFFLFFTLFSQLIVVFTCHAFLYCAKLFAVTSIATRPVKLVWLSTLPPT